MTRWLTPEEDRAWRGWRRMRLLLDLRLGRDLGDAGLSEPDYDVLSTLTEAPSASWRANELAGHLLWSSSRLAHHVGRMERRGLVARGSYDGDGRGATVSLTPLGRATLERAAPDHVESVRRNFVDLLTPAEIETLTRIADKVVTRLEPTRGLPPREPDPTGRRRGGVRRRRS